MGYEQKYDGARTKKCEGKRGEVEDARANERTKEGRDEWDGWEGVVRRVI
jgi:hypothetical protein